MKENSNTEKKAKRFIGPEDQYRVNEFLRKNKAKLMAELHNNDELRGVINKELGLDFNTPIYQRLAKIHDIRFRRAPGTLKKSTLDSLETRVAKMEADIRQLMVIACNAAAPKPEDIQSLKEYFAARG